MSDGGYLTKQQFVADCCRRFRITEAEFWQRASAQPCTCGEEGCCGWDAIPRTAPTMGVGEMLEDMAIEVATIRRETETLCRETGCSGYPELFERWFCSDPDVSEAVRRRALAWCDPRNREHEG